MLKRFEAALASYDIAITLKPDYAEAYNNRGNTLKEVTRLAEALSSFDKAIVLKPDYADAYNNRGIVLKELRRFEEALASYDKAVALKPEYAEAYNNRGNALLELRRLDEALASYNVAIALKSDYANACGNRANVLRELKRFEEAVVSYDRAIVLRPDHADAYHDRGNALRELKRLDEAVASYDKAIALNPDYAEAYNNRGNTLTELGRLENAVASYDIAITLKPAYAEAFCNRANALLELKHLEDALATYDRAIVLKPDFADAYNNRGIVLKELQRFEEALTSYDRAICLRPEYAEAYNNRGNALLELGRLDEALASYDRAIALKPGHADAYDNRGNALKELKRLDEAVASYDRAIGLNPDYAGAYNNRGNALVELRRLEAALANYDRAIALNPDYAGAYNNRGNALKALGRLEDAVASYDMAVALKPAYAEAFFNRGIALAERQRFDDALASYDRAIALKPDYVSAYNNRGLTLGELNRLDEALESYDRALELCADDVDAQWNRSLLLLLMGRFIEGWKGYEWRRKNSELGIKRSFLGPEWEGDIKSGRRLLIYADQALGDTMQFARFALLLADKGVHVAFEVPKALKRLLASSLQGITVLGRDDELPPYDAHCPLMSLPYFLELDDVPAAASYLAAEQILIERWRNRLPSGGLRVGIAWQGNPKGKVDLGRSIPLRAFAPIARVPGVTLVSLQKNDGLNLLQDLPEDIRIVTPGEFDIGADAFVDTAAIMMNLDLVVTSDTSIAHLAGALGRPVWVALKHVPDWRWMMQRRDSAWYPSMRLFRQPSRGDWDSVMSEMAAELERLRSTDEKRGPSESTEVTALAQLNELFEQAFALHRRGRLNDAQALYKQILGVRSEHPNALHLLGVCVAQLGDPEQSVDLITKAIAIEPNVAEMHGNLGASLHQLKRYGDAVASCDKAIALKPDYVEAYNSRGVALKEMRRLEDALSSYDKAIALKRDFVSAYYNRGTTLLELKRFDDGLASYEQAIALNPDFADAHNNRGNALLELQRFSDALSSYDKAIVLKPNYAEAYNYRGIALKELRRLEDALASCDTAIALKPGYAEAHSDRGVVLRELRRLTDALESYDTAITLKPDYANAYNNRGIALKDLKRFDDALADYDRAIASKRDFVSAYYNRGNVLGELKRYEAALSSYDEAFALNPDFAYLRGYRLHARMMICDWRLWHEETTQLLAKLLAGEKVAPPFPMVGLPSSRGQQLDAARSWAFDHPRSYELPAIVKRARRDKIRIGYFSADFHNHATGWLIAELIEKHDRSRFDVMAFSFGVDSNDETRKRLMAAFDSFFDVRNQSDKDVALLARRHEVDIAVDLKGYTQEARTNIFALGAGPIQVNFLGYPGTMGADYIDYLIADPTLIPVSHQKDYAEKIVYLPDCYQPNDTKRRIADRAFTRAEVGLPPEGFVFCCFNNNYKITPEVFDSWMGILRRVPGSVLWLLEGNPAAAANLRKEADNRGIGSGRLVFARRMGTSEHLARHRLADLFLDTLPCNAHTTASDALWVGLPVLTQLGETFAGRVAASLLNAIGLPELITSTREDYENLAVELATNRASLQQLRHKLAANRPTAPLFDIDRYTRHIEAAYSTMYERYLADLSPAHIFIDR